MHSKGQCRAIIYFCAKLQHRFANVQVSIYFVYPDGSTTTKQQSQFVNVMNFQANEKNNGHQITDISFFSISFNKEIKKQKAQNAEFRSCTNTKTIK